MTALLEIENLTIGLENGNDLVHDISLQIQPGEIHGLIGESGSGKSLTALSILQLLPSSILTKSGEIRLNIEGQVNVMNNLEIKDLRKIRGNQVGFIFQDPMTSLNPSAKCGNQVAEVLKTHDIECESGIRSEVLNLFKKVRLPDPEKAFNSYPHELSGGQRQRIIIAMAVACKPKLLIADEPTTALDVSVQKSILELIDELRKSDQLGVLFISHDLGVISNIADMLSIMFKGKIIESGVTKEIIQHPKEPYTHGLLGCKPPLDKMIQRLPTVAEFLEDPENAKAKLSVKAPIMSYKDKILEVRNLSAFYPLRTNIFGKVVREMNVLKNVEFDVFKGESLGLVGESGSGKTSLGRTLLRLLETRSGEIIYNGTDLSKLDGKSFKDYRQKIQFIFQDPYSSLNPKMQVGEILGEPLKVHKIYSSSSERKNRVSELLELVGLTNDDAGKFPHQFSGGQRQRIVIARALTLNPEFLVCDEAVSALDVSVQAQILNLLKDLKEEFGLTYLFITHDMSVVRFFCDRTIVLKDGAIEELGSTSDMFNSPKSSYTRELLESIH